MKIALLHFWTFRMRRGVETMVVSLANEIADLGQDVSIVTTTPTLSPLVAPSGAVHVKAYPTFRYFEFITIVPFYVWDLIRSQYDVVIVFFADFGEGTALKLADRFAKPRLILNLTFPVESAPHRYRAYLQWGWHKKVAKILADAQYTAQRGEEYLHRPVELLPSGTDPRRFYPNPALRERSRKKLGFDEGDTVLLNVAALEERKGIWRVIEAMPDICAQHPSIRYLVLGDGRDKERLIRRVAELGMKEKVIFAGTTTDLPSYYNAADIFVLLSDSEAGSVACLEAMSTGLPVVASNTGGFGEVVDETSGRLVNIHDQTAIVNAILELAQNANLRAKIGSAGRNRILQNFSWTKIAERLLLFCKDVI